MANKQGQGKPNRATMNTIKQINYRAKITNKHPTPIERIKFIGRSGEAAIKEIGRKAGLLKR